MIYKVIFFTFWENRTCLIGTFSSAPQKLDHISCSFGLFAFESKLQILATFVILSLERKSRMFFFISAVGFFILILISASAFFLWQRRRVNLLSCCASIFFLSELNIVSLFVNYLFELSGRSCDLKLVLIFLTTWRNSFWIIDAFALNFLGPTPSTTQCLDLSLVVKELVLSRQVRTTGPLATGPLVTGLLATGLLTAGPFRSTKKTSPL